jgi:glucose/arabinose dehydrogenase
MTLRIPLIAIYLLLIVPSATALAQVTYQDAFPDLSFEYPTEIMSPGDGTNRLFVLEQAGRIKVFQNNENTAVAETFLDITPTVSFSSGQEIGLLGLAFHPDYANNGLFYVYHTRQSSISGVNVEIVLARYSVRADNPDQADPSSRLDILSFDKNQSNSNHNGGKIAFGPDGYLYISIGDGGGGGDPNKNAQNLDNVFGSILRIDVDLDGNNPLESNPDAPNGNYEIPSDNPRVGMAGLDELYAWGIRNTWKFSFDAPMGNMWGADVGQGDREEINLILKGGNYGWNRFEGNTVEDGSTVLATTPDIKPIFEYGRNSGDISITGGYVYRGTSNNPQIKEKYIYGDYISGRVWALDYDPSSGNATSELLFRTNGQYISSFGLDEYGELYFSDYGTSSKLYRIIGGNNGPQTVAVDGVGDWYAMAQGTNGNVGAMAAQANEAIVIGGGFTTAGGIASTNIALYDPDSGWNDFGNGTNGDIKSIAIDNEGKVYVGGDFSQIAGIQANSIAVWNGSWSPLGQGTNGPVSSIGIAADDKVYVGGTFEMAGGTAVNNIALWEDGSWIPLTDGGTGTPGTNNEVRAISMDENGQVYIGGNFDSAGGKTAPRIAVWDGTVWGTLGTGTSGFVQAIAINPDYIYAGGNFAVAGNGTVNRIARWNRSSEQWEALGLGLSGNVNALALDGDHLYVGGSFETASDQQDVHKIMNNVARWSEDNGWQALGNGTDVGVDNIVNSLTFDNIKSRLYVGGTFDLAGEKGAGNIAIWSETIIIPPTDPELSDILYPNPFEDIINIEVKNSSTNIIKATLFTISGIMVSSKDYSVQNELVTLEFPILSSGLYYLKLHNEDTDKAYKVIKR